MRVIDLDVTKPELQAVRAAQELLDANYPIVFPCDTMHCILMRYSAENAKSLYELTAQKNTFPCSYPKMPTGKSWLRHRRRRFAMREWRRPQYAGITEVFSAVLP